MIELKWGCSVPFPERLFEQYAVSDNMINANVGASKVLDMMKRFAQMRDEPMFFILEIPRKEPDNITESKILKNVDDYDVYFIDGLNVSDACSVVDALGPLLVRDGMNMFGLGCHKSGEEILFGRYNLMNVYTQNSEKYKGFFADFGIKKVDNLVTAWDTFDEDHPGECHLYVSETTGKTIYDIPDAYKDYGMYLYEAVSEYDNGSQKTVKHADILGKILLVGITYYSKDNDVVKQEQFHGKVIKADVDEVCVLQNDGSTLILPGDLSSTRIARPGEYKLRSTGEVVTNPDFLATWNFVEGE